MIEIKHLTAALPALALVLFGTVGLGIAELRPSSATQGPIGILVSSGDAADAVRVIAAADGRLVSSGGWLNGAIAVSDDPDFVAKLYRAGAILVYRADGAVGCRNALSSDQRTS